MCVPATPVRMGALVQTSRHTMCAAVHLGGLEISVRIKIQVRWPLGKKENNSIRKRICHMIQRFIILFIQRILFSLELTCNVSVQCSCAMLLLCLKKGRYSDLTFSVTNISFYYLLLYILEVIFCTCKLFVPWAYFRIRTKQQQNTQKSIIQLDWLQRLLKWSYFDDHGLITRR